MHLVVKAVSEEGRRLNIRKATLREWRELFAEQLRSRGVEANATPRALRGQSRTTFKDAIYRAAKRGQSRHLRERVTRIARQLRSGGLEPEAGKGKLLDTRRAVMAGWQAAADQLLAAGQGALAEKIWGFVGQMRPPRTTNEQLAAKILQSAKAREPEKEFRAR